MSSESAKKEVTLSNAREAARMGAFAPAWLAISYAIQLFTQLFGEAPAPGIERLPNAFYGVMVVLFFFLAFVVYTRQSQLAAWVSLFFVASEILWKFESIAQLSIIAAIAAFAAVHGAFASMTYNRLRREMGESSVL